MNQEPSHLQRVSPSIITLPNVEPINSEKSNTDLIDNDAILDNVQELNQNHSLPESASPSIMNLRNFKPTTTQRAPIVDYQISPMNSEESDADLSDNDRTYNVNQVPRRRSASTSSTVSNFTPDTPTTSTAADETVPRNITRKRKADPTKWKQNMRKIKRNLGQEYISANTNKQSTPARQMRPPCSQKCRLKCIEKLDDDKRQAHFKSFWALGDLQLQRMFVLSSMVTVTPKYKYSNAERPREPNKAYYLKDDNEKVRVCKTFFTNTLGITPKMIRTVINKSKNNNYMEDDKRGKHNQHKRVSDDLKNDIKDFINSIPRIESHYLRASTSREYISGGKTIAELFRDFEKLQKEKSREAGKFNTFYEVFTTQFNIGFFQPKKDQCDLCLQYHNSVGDQKRTLKEKYETHHEEKLLSREEKKMDRKNVDEYNLCVCYDVQAIMQSPNGDTSSFFYKSKLNSLNFTMTELNKLKEGDKTGDDCKSYGDVHCYFWDETQGKRGAVEIGSCILDYLKMVSEKAGDREINVTFYSDNCCGQNKNKYVAALYMYAVTNLKNLKTITHKYLIKGHTQNEADNVHSLIQKQIDKDLKSGPIYTPVQYMAAIQRARKTGKPFAIHSLLYDFFYDVKLLQENWGYNFNVDEQKNTVAWNDIKVMKFTKDKPFSLYYKTSYKEDFKEINVRNKRKRMSEHTEISIQKAYSQPFALSANKKKDLKELVSKKLIDPYYASYFDTMLL